MKYENKKIPDMSSFNFNPNEMNITRLLLFKSSYFDIANSGFSSMSFYRRYI